MFVDGTIVSQIDAILISMQTHDVVHNPHNCSI